MCDFWPLVPEAFVTAAKSNQIRSNITNKPEKLWKTHHWRLRGLKSTGLVLKIMHKKSTCWMKLCEIMISFSWNSSFNIRQCCHLEACRIVQLCYDTGMKRFDLLWCSRAVFMRPACRVEGCLQIRCSKLLLRFPAICGAYQFLTKSGDWRWF